MITQTMTVEKWGVFELVLAGPSTGNPFKEVALSCEFSFKNRRLVPEGFYDGAGVFKVRFMPDVEGEWRYRTISNVSELNDLQGRFTCAPAQHGNHGPVGVLNTYHFGYADGAPHYSFGTTCYAWVHQTIEMQQQTLETLKSSPFNKIRMCVFPKHYAYNKNEPDLYPFERDEELKVDLERFSPAFFQHFEEQVGALRDMGIEADIIIFHPYDRWGHSKMDPETDDRYIRYLVARLAAYRNVWWSMANEFDFLDAKTMTDWDRFFRVLMEADPYNHLRGIHNGAVRYGHEKPWITHVSVQTADMYSGKAQRELFRKPVVFDEVCYEGDIPETWGNITAKELVHRFWAGTIVGCYVGHGETYLHPEDLLWWAKGGALRGKSAPRIAFLRSILEDGPKSGLNPLSDQWHDWNKVAGKHGEYYLLYFDVHAPARWTYLSLPDGIQFKIDIIDTWNMTITPMEGVFEGKCDLELPGKPYMAVRARRI
jgi:hypothetical protein